MEAGQTLRNDPSGAPERAPLLTRVLSYEELARDASERFAIDLAKPVVIGRAADAKSAGLAGQELRLHDGWMSAAHARIEHKEGRVVIRDLGSKNGTFVNGAQAGEQVLADGDLIEVGHQLLCFRRSPRPQLDALDEVGARLRHGPTRTLSPELAALLRDLERIAPSSEPVLILAESGAGKEHLSETLHQLSGRKGPFWPVDCGAVPDSLFEATFFGHAKGAFTGAETARVGEIVRADGGTLFLDEVGNLSAAAQAKLLRVIEDGRVTPLGAAQPVRVDVRVVAATNRDVYADDGFRADLLRRLAGFTARLPPLRRRREDLGILTAFLLQQAGVKRASITVAAARALFCDDFTGNVRQLRAALRSAALLAGASPIDLAHLPEGAPPTADSPAAPLRDKGAPTAEALAASLEESGGNVVRAATALGTHPRQLYRWIEKYGLDFERYRK